MKWLCRMLGAVPKQEREGARLDVSGPHWEMEGPTTFVDLLSTIQDWLPEDAVLYFEGGYPDAEIIDFMARYSIPEQTHIAMGTIWPRPKVFHVPATRTALTELCKIMEHHAEPELAVHFHVYKNGTVLLEWYDAFAKHQPLRVSGSFPEEDIRILAGRFGKSFSRQNPKRGPSPT